MDYGVEIDFVVSDSLKALDLYEKIFDVERIEVSNLPKGENEAVFTIFDSRFHMLDENPDFHLHAPNPEHPNTMWINIIVSDIEETYNKAIEAGCKEIQPITELPEYGVTNAMFSDPFGYIWMLHQVHRAVSHEERIRLWEEQKEDDGKRLT